MAISLLEYNPLSQNQRVSGFEIPNDDLPRIYTTDNLLTDTELDTLMMAAYRQIYNEQQMLSSHRQLCLESQLCAGQITVRGFIRGLLLSDSFRRLVFECNNNYRFVEICIQRVLGRNVYSDREKITWSIVIATKGIEAFIDALLGSDEYLNNFGDSIVPYQRRRILPSRNKGEVTFAHTTRYGADYRDRLPKQVFKGNKGAARLDYLRWEWQKSQPAIIGKIGAGFVYAGAGFVGILILAVFLGF
ncbi:MULTISPECIES: phycobilisome rod-core linker polypeptide [Pseudanabaena]|uniref:Phycobilisome linker polypeptide n=2 Tax=Pseudanabaena TaxID=1152 RepID=L8MW85_9CYAN|nr:MULTISPECIES: phycobilisome rod-core linker polypeptide [Pseudanabaena]ELS30720.1 Phycobilisome linker polypeptide [Pseudanabaena biceps PCC 7429]MDG3497010.1 phycobilisome rod-core linker polypeptide [Pseudanabaena catenata USMAC16]